MKSIAPTASPSAQPNTPVKATLSAFVISCFTSYLFSLIAALCWRGEEPSKAQTIIVALVVNTLAILVVLLAKRARFISSPAWWVTLFGCKFFINVMLTMYVWHEPLAPDLLRVPEVVVGVQDSNLYDYYAMEAARQGILISWPLLNFTWLSFGITGYLASVYSFLGASIAYVSMCNALLSVAGLMMLTATLRRLFGVRRRWDLVAMSAFIPSIAYYDATPAKEPLTNLFFYSALFALVYLNQRRRFDVPTVLKAIAPLGILALIRANVALMLVAANAWPQIRRFGIIRSSVAIVSSAALAAIVLIVLTGSTSNLAAIFNIGDAIERTSGFVQERADAGESGLKQLVAENLAPRSLGHLVALSPVRTVIWLYLPYPLIIPTVHGLVPPPTLLYQDRLGKLRITHELAYAITGWLLIFATPFLLGAILQFARDRHPGLAVLLFNIAVPAALIGNMMFIMGRRYRTLIEPLIFAIVLVAWRFKASRQLAPIVWIGMTIGVMVVAALRS